MDAALDLMVPATNQFATSQNPSRKHRDNAAERQKHGS